MKNTRQPVRRLPGAHVPEHKCRRFRSEFDGVQKICADDAKAEIGCTSNRPADCKHNFSAYSGSNPSAHEVQTDPKDSEIRQLLTGEINSADPGFVDGGATNVFVWDWHGGSETLSALTIDSRAHLVMSHERAAAMAKVGTIQPYRVKGLSQSESNTPAGTRSRPMPL
jgi:hypothetical protein